MHRQPPSSIFEFWREFKIAAPSIRSDVLAGNIDIAHERVSSLLRDYGFEFVHEITSDEADAVLIFTPESDLTVAALVDEVLAAAPQLNGWRLFGRRQRKDVDDALRMAEDLYEVALNDARFTVCGASMLEIQVTMFTSAAEAFEVEVGDGLAAFFLEHAIGEEIVMKFIKDCRLRSIDQAPSENYTPKEMVSMILGAVNDAHAPLPKVEGNDPLRE